MSNTTIQIKRSSVTAVPASLTAAEPAYSYVSDKFFIGNSTGTGSIAIGGKFFIDQQNTIYDAVNAAFNAANTNPIGTAGFNAANAAFLNSNNAFNAANAAFANANSGYLIASSAFNTANAAYANANAGYLIASSSFNAANAAFLNSNNSFNAANASFAAANAAFANANAGYLIASSSFNAANAAYANANTKFSSSGGTITGDVSIIGNLVLSGNTLFQNVATLQISDPLIYLAANNYSTDLVDIGFVANYVNATGSNVHTGLYRDSTTKEYYAFQGYDQEPINNHIDPTGNNFSLAVFNAHIRTSNLNLAGVNAFTWIQSAHVQANAASLTANVAYNSANAAFANANAGYLIASSSFNAANAAFLNSNNVFGAANASFGAANAAFLNANNVFNAANASYATANAAFLNSNNAFNAANAGLSQANTAYTQANNAYSFANTANVNAANASYLSVGTVPSARVSGSYTGITGVGVLTAGTWNADTVKVPYGGTGLITVTTNGILYGNSTGDLKVTAAGTEGQVLQASATGVPSFGMLDGGSF